MAKTKEAPGLMKTEVVAQSLTQRLPLAPSVIAGQVCSLDEQAEKAVAVAERAEIKTAGDAGNAADVLRAISAQLRLVDSQRKKHTDPLDDAKSQIMNLFRVPFAKFTKAQLVLKNKVTAWRRVEEARLTAEAEEKRKERLRLAEQKAAAQVALGDADGAQRIAEEAAALPVEPEKVRAVGIYGSSLGSRKRSVGNVVDRRAFLQELAGSRDPLLTEILDGIEFPKVSLNRLAAAIHKAETLNPNGFEAQTEDSSVVR